MRRNKRGKQALWRWRSNPLRRRDDIVEAWIVLAVWTVVALGGTLAGLVTARAADESFARQRAGLQPVRAVLVKDAAPAVPAAEGVSYARVAATVRWTGADGSPRSSRALVDAGQKAGAKVQVWANGQGKLTTEPATVTEAAFSAALLGAAAALGLGGVTYAAGRGVRGRLERRRLDRWGREWDRVGPQWARRTP